MKIDRLFAENFKGFKVLDLSLEGKSTVLFGINGAGKSSVLDAINMLYAPIINKITANAFKQIDSLDVSDIKFGESITELHYVTHFGDSGVSRWEFAYSRRMERKTKKRTHNLKQLEQFATYFRNNFLIEDNDMPIYANYGTHRTVHVVPIRRIREKNDFDKTSAFSKAIVNTIDFKTFFEWYRDRQEYENHIKINNDSGYTDLQLSCVKKAILSMLNDLSDIKIMFNPLRMVATKYGENIMIEQLSDGEKCTLAMIGDLARRLALANPKSDDPLNGNGVVLIDEIELHLHPSWQAKILKTLFSTFPNIQFIVTTHSPKVLSELDSDANLFELSNNNNTITANQIPLLNGWDTSYILGNYMSTNPYNSETEVKLNHMFELIQKRQFKEAETLIEGIETITSSINPEIVKAKILLARERKGI